MGYPKSSGDSFRQLSAGIDFSGDEIGNRAAARLAAEIAVEERLYFAKPRHFYRCAAGKDDRNVFVCFTDRLRQRIMARREVHMEPVIASAS